MTNHRSITLKLSGFACAMFGFAFAMVPLYNAFCDITGLNGKVELNGNIVAVAPSGIDRDRTITVEFDVSHNRNMPWQFKPQHLTMSLHPGEVKHTAYFAYNPTKRTMVAQAIPSIAPGLSAQYFKKVQCFCFSPQILKPGEARNMILRFYVDPDIPKDIKRLTLSYSLFDVTNRELIPGGDHPL